MSVGNDDQALLANGQRVRWIDVQKWQQAELKETGSVSRTVVHPKQGQGSQPAAILKSNDRIDREIAAKFATIPDINSNRDGDSSRPITGRGAGYMPQPEIETSAEFPLYERD